MQNNKSLHEIAIQAIQLEGDAIMHLQNYVNESFEKCMQVLLSCTGRIIITGVGKSAIIAQKIVSTLNSTGTPSLFLHAADAIHGDLGMVQADDVVLLISKSGESAEIKVLLPLIKNFGNITIGMVGNMDSFLAKNTHYIINTTVAKEACPNNLAPTTSTTAQLVMGDVIAICLMEKKGFHTSQFAKYHPGGTLGKKLYLTVEDLYKNNEKPAVHSSANLKQVIIEISKKRLGAAVVVNTANEVEGIITDGDIRRALEKYDTLNNVLASEIVNKNVKTINESALAMDALQIMKAHDIMQLVVVKDKQYLGIIHLHEIIKEGII